MSGETDPRWGIDAAFVARVKEALGDGANPIHYERLFSGYSPRELLVHLMERMISMHNGPMSELAVQMSIWQENHKANYSSVELGLRIAEQNLKALQFILGEIQAQVKASEVI